MSEETFELLVGVNRQLILGQQGGIGEVLKRLDVMDAKLDKILAKSGTIDIINAKLPEAQSS